MGDNESEFIEADVDLRMRPSEGMEDWYVVERSVHDGRVWMEQTGPGSAALRCSARISDADVEGTGEEMCQLAAAILAGKSASFRRCAVDATVVGWVYFWSPRNSTKRARVSALRARDLALSIVRRLRG